MAPECLPRHKNAKTPNAQVPGLELAEPLTRGDSLWRRTVYAVLPSSLGPCSCRECLRDESGHKDLRMAARYQHLSPGFLAEAVGTLDAAFGDCHQYVSTGKPVLALELCHPNVTARGALPAAIRAGAF